jgi:hypothetical protein
LPTVICRLFAIDPFLCTLKGDRAFEALFKRLRLQYDYLLALIEARPASPS